MKFIVDKSVLVTALARCLSVTDPKSPMPLLGSVYIAAGKMLLTIGATDLYRGITAKVEAEIDEQGSIALPARDLHDRIKSLPEGKIGFVVEGTQAVIKAIGASRRFTMHGAPGEQFPVIPKATGVDAKWQTTTHKLGRIIGSVAPAICSDSSRPAINCMMVQQTDDGVRAVAVDNGGMSTVLFGSEPEGASRWLVPLTAVNDLRRLCDTKSEEEITLQQDGRTVFVRFEDFIFSTQLMETSAVWEQEVWREACKGTTEKATRTVTLDRLQFIDSLRAVALSASDRTGGVRFSFRKNSLVLQAKNATDGEGFDELSFAEDAEPGDVAFNHKSVLDAVSVLATDKITLATGAADAPGAIRVPGSEVYLAIIMPMSL